MRLNYWSAQRQWQWVEDYCLWLQDGFSPVQAAHAMWLSAREAGLVKEQHVAAQLQHSLHSGQPLVTALRGWLANDLLQVFAIGQQCDCLTEVLARYQRFQQQRRQLLLVLWRQRLYPLFVLSLVLLAVIAASQRFLPALIERAELVQLPLSVRIVLTLGNGLRDYGLAGLLVVLMLVGGYQWASRHWLSPLRFRLERWGFFAERRSLSAVWITQMVALLLQQRLGLRELLLRLQPLPTPYTRYHLLRMQSRLAQGQRRLAQVMNTGLLTPRLLFRLQNSGRKAAAVDGLWRTALRAHEDAERWLVMRQRGVLALLYCAIVGLILLLMQASATLLMAVMTLP